MTPYIIDTFYSAKSILNFY